MTIRAVKIFWIISFSILAHVLKAQDEWTHFRGSHLNAIAPDGQYPISWSADANILWKTQIHGLGWSSPVVYKNQVWMTTAVEDGKGMYAVCVDLNSGQIVKDIKVFTPDTIFRKHSVNSYATPTPCVEMDRVYVHFGTYGTACLNAADGSIVWKRTDLNCRHVQGPGASPVIYKDFLMLHLEGTDRQLIYALNKQTGEIVWQTERPKDIYDQLEPIGKKAYITPIFISVDGKDIMISNGSAMCAAYDLETGEKEPIPPPLSRTWRTIRRRS